MTIYGFEKEEDARSLLDLLNQPREENPIREVAPVREPPTLSVGLNARWFAKTPPEGIDACEYDDDEFDADPDDETWEQEVPSAMCKLYLISTNPETEKVTVRRYLTDGGAHGVLRIGNLSPDAVPGNWPIGFNRAVGGAFIADWGPCGG